MVTTLKLSLKEFGKNLKNKNISHYFHRLSNDFREQDKLFVAKIFGYIAIGFYKIDHDSLGLSDAFQSLVLIYKHKFLLSQNNTYIKLAQIYAKKSLDLSLSKKLNNLHTCYFRLGEIDLLKNDFSSAVKNFQKALKHFPKNNSEKGNYQYHLGESQYRHGDKKLGLKNILNGLETIEKYQIKTDSFLIHVWQSGCLMRLAELLQKDNPSQSQKYLSQADKIISNDPRLIIRKRQLIDFKNKLNYGQK